MPADLVRDFRRELRSGVVHRQHDALDLESRDSGDRERGSRSRSVGSALRGRSTRIGSGSAPRPRRSARSRSTARETADSRRGSSRRSSATPSSALARRRSRCSSGASSTSAPASAIADGANESPSITFGMTTPATAGRPRARRTSTDRPSTCRSRIRSSRFPGDRGRRRGPVRPERAR